MQRIAYNQVANKYTLMRDDIQPKRLMIYQACDLDKKSHLEDVIFWWRRRDLHSGLIRFIKVFYILIRQLVFVAVLVNGDQ